MTLEELTKRDWRCAGCDIPAPFDCDCITSVAVCRDPKFHAVWKYEICPELIDADLASDPQVQALILAAEARGMERAAEIVREQCYDEPREVYVSAILDALIKEEGDG